jgi:hypothetical protein
MTCYQQPNINIRDIHDFGASSERQLFEKPLHELAHVQSGAIGHLAQVRVPSLSESDTQRRGTMPALYWL